MLCNDFTLSYSNRLVLNCMWCYQLESYARQNSARKYYCQRFKTRNPLKTMTLFTFINNLRSAECFNLSTEKIAIFHKLYTYKYAHISTLIIFKNRQWSFHCRKPKRPFSLLALAGLRDGITSKLTVLIFLLAIATYPWRGKGTLQCSCAQMMMKVYYRFGLGLAMLI